KDSPLRTLRPEGRALTSTRQPHVHRPPSRAETGVVRVRAHRLDNQEVVMNPLTKTVVALAVAAGLAAIAATLAFGAGTQNGATRVQVAKTRLGRILVDSKGVTLY